MSNSITIIENQKSLALNNWANNGTVDGSRGHLVQQWRALDWFGLDLDDTEVVNVSWVSIQDLVEAYDERGIENLPNWIPATIAKDILMSGRLVLGCKVEVTNPYGLGKVIA